VRGADELVGVVPRLPGQGNHLLKFGAHLAIPPADNSGLMRASDARSTTRLQDPGQRVGATVGESRALPSGPVHAQLLDLLVAQDRDAQLLTRLQRLERFEDLDHVLVAGDRHSLDGEQDVASDHELLTFDDPDPISATQTELTGGRVLDDLLDEESADLRHAQRLRPGARDQYEVDAVPATMLLHEQLVHGVGGDDEAEPFAATGLADVVTDDSDQLAGASEHGPAGIAGIDHGVGLEELGQRKVPRNAVGLPARADD